MSTKRDPRVLLKSKGTVPLKSASVGRTLLRALRAPRGRRRSASRAQSVRSTLRAEAAPAPAYRWGFGFSRISTDCMRTLPGMRFRIRLERSSQLDRPRGRLTTVSRDSARTFLGSSLRYVAAPNSIRNRRATFGRGSFASTIASAREADDSPRPELPPVQ